MTSSSSPSLVAIDGRLHAGEPRPGRHVAAGGQVLLAHHVVQVEPRAGDDHAGVAPVRRGERAGVPCPVDRPRRGSCPASDGTATAGVGSTRERRRRRPRGSPATASSEQHVAPEAAAVEEPGEPRPCASAPAARIVSAYARSVRARPGGRGPGTPSSTDEHVTDEDAARRRRRVRRDHVASVGNLERAPPDRPVGGQIRHRERAARRVLVIDHRPGQLARVEVIGALGQPLDRRRRGPAGESARLRRPAAPSGQKTALTSGVCLRISRMATSTAYCPPELATPRSAASAAGRSRSRQGIDPNRRCTAWRPARTPGTAHAAAPMWNTCVVCSSNGTSTRSTSASIRSARRLLARDRRERVEDVHAPRPRRAHHQEPAAARARSAPARPPTTSRRRRRRRRPRSRRARARAPRPGR